MFQKAGGTGQISLLAEVLYRLQDIKLVLTLLRHGVMPSGVYLWPISIMIDFRYALTDKDDPLTDNTHEIQVLHIFCRAKRTFHILPFDSDDDNPFSLQEEDLASENMLLLPSKAKHLIPVDRYREPASLMQQCRCTIREVLLQTDNLPDGIRKLHVPRLIISYLDLLID